MPSTPGPPGPVVSADPGRRDVDLRGAALALLISMIWGANPVAIKIGLVDAPPLRLAAFRFILGGSAIALWAWLTGRLTDVRVPRREVRPLLVLGVLFSVQIALMNIGTSLTSAAHSSLMLNLYAVHTVVLSHFLIPGDRLSLRTLGGVCVAYAGIVPLIWRHAGGDGATLTGDAIVFVSGFLLAERTVYLARAVQHVDGVKLLLAQALVGSAAFVALSFGVEPQPTRWTASLLTALGFQGVVVAGFNFVVNVWLLKRYRPSGLAAFFLTQPLFGVVIAALVTGDRLTPDLLVAAVAVAVGVGITTR